LEQTGGPFSAACAGKPTARPTAVTATMDAKRNGIMLSQPPMSGMATPRLFPTAGHHASRPARPLIRHANDKGAAAPVVPFP